MSVRNIQGQGGYRALDGSNVANKTLRNNPNVALGPWVRNSLWPAVATPAANEILALYAAFGETGAPDFIALSISTSAGQYRVQLGDGTDTNVNSGAQFDGSINYSALPDLGLPYRICTVRITPVTGGASITNVNLAARHTTLTASNPIANWLEIKINAPSSPTNQIAVSSSGTKASYLENIEVSGNWSPGNGFLNQSAVNLRSASLTFVNTTNFSMASALAGCRLLTDVIVQFTGAGLPNNTSSMFSDCVSLTSVPLFNTASVTSMSSMFQSCVSLTSVPLFNTASVTNMTSMLQGCVSLTSVPLFNTAAVTDMSSMFSGCRSLTSVPLFNTASVTNMQSMFQGCSSLTSIPLFNTAAVTAMNNMFQNCSSLTSVPLFNTAAVTNMQNMFGVCTSLTSVPLFNTAAVTTMASMFNTCSALRTIPALNFAGVTSSTNFSNIFASCVLQRIQATGARFTHTIASNSLSGTALDEYYTGLPTVTGQTLTVTGNYGTTTDTPSIATGKGWTVTGT